MFNEVVVSNLRYYVYRLVDPSSNQTFYIGKGRGNRVFHHARGEVGKLMHESEEDEIALKLTIIQSIHAAGLKVIHLVHRHGMDESTAFEVESALIDAYSNLANQQGGVDSGDRGCMSVGQIIEKYGLPAIVTMPEEKLILININRSYDQEGLTLLEKVQCAWKMDSHKAKRAEYVLAVARGVVRGVFKPEKWVDATKEYFPSRLNETQHGRIGFLGRQVMEGPVHEKFCGEHGKRIEVGAKKHVQNPIRYYKL